MALDFNAFQMGQAASGDPVADMLATRLGNLQAQGVQIQNQAAQQQLAFQRIALQRQQQYAQDVQSFAQNPTVTGLATLWKYPEFQANTKGIYDAMDPRMRQAETTQLGEVASLLQNGQIGGATKIVQQRISADQAAGRDTTGDRQALAMLQSGDPKQINAVKGMVASLIAGSVGFDKAAEYLKAVGLSQEPVKTTPGDTYTNPLNGQTVAAQPTNLSPQVLNIPGGAQELVGFNPNPGANNGSVSTEGGGPASAGGAAHGAPRSVRNNNPGNLKATPFTKSQPGYSGVDGAGYAIFSSPQDGIAAQAALLGGKNYYAGGRKTVAAIVSKWAPPQSAGGDNTNAQVANYIAYVSKQLGVKPNDVLSPQQLPQLAQAMAGFEAGATGHAGPVRVPPTSVPQAQSSAQDSLPAGVVASTGSTGALNTQGAEPGYAWNADHTKQFPVPGGTADFSPDALNAATDQYLLTNQLPGGMGGGAIKSAVMKNVPARLTALGLQNSDLPALRSKYKSLTGSLTQNAQILNMLEASETALHSNAQQVLNTQAQLVKDGIIDNGSPALNNLRLETYTHVGSAQTKADIKRYEDAVNGLTQEYTKFMNSANGMGGNAAPSDAARGLALDLNDKGQGPASMRAHINQIFVETANKRNGIGAQNSKISAQLSSLIAPHSPLPPGATVIGTYHGKRVIEVNGQRMVEQ